MCVISTCGRGCMLSKLSNAQIFQSYSVRFHQILFCLIFSLCPWLSHKRIPNFGKRKAKIHHRICLNPPVWGSWEKPEEEGQLLSMASQFDSKMSVFSFGANHNSASNDVYHRFWWHKQRQKDIGKILGNIKTSPICQRRLKHGFPSSPSKPFMASLKLPSRIQIWFPGFQFQRGLEKGLPW